MHTLEFLVRLHCGTRIHFAHNVRLEWLGVRYAPRELKLLEVYIQI